MLLTYVENMTKNEKKYICERREVKKIEVSGEERMMREGVGGKDEGESKERELKKRM